MDNKKFQKSSEIFFCEKCDYFTCRRSQFERHKTTLKHKRIKMDNEDNKKVPDDFTSEEIIINLFETT